MSLIKFPMESCSKKPSSIFTSNEKFLLIGRSNSSSNLLPTFDEDPCTTGSTGAADQLVMRENECVSLSKIVTSML
ncbi:hypothetical protein ACNR91_003907 [Candidozyma auris]